MIYDYTDFIEDLEKLHPDIERKSLEKIVKTGLFGVSKLMRDGKELIVRGGYKKSNDWIKFFIPMTPENQQKHAIRNKIKKDKYVRTDINK